MSADRPLRVLIVDDEQPAREKLRLLLAGDAGVTVVGEARDGVEAVRAIAELDPDLVLLDVQMPGLDGFEVLDALEGLDGEQPSGERECRRCPLVVFVTAYDRFAVRAFEVNAVDYLLKPVTRERLAETLARARATELEAAARVRRSGALTAAREQRMLRRFLIRIGGRLRVIDAREVLWLEAAGNYVDLHLADRRHAVRGSLAAIAARLDPDRFARVHRSAVVNLDWVVELVPISHGDYRLVLRNGAEVKLSRRYRDRLPATLGA
ncbi:MAG TPA: LytTR family DNA-binding domain-containing protein [Thermoanaerobaculia bacterium]|nr:LytTR family DNA-binding domain-containing protein [Thermoanaerobaculia bacterium]